MSLPPPPPPPPPPPAGGQSNGGAAPPAVVAMEQEQVSNEFRQALTLAARKLEAARCHETELEAWNVYASSQLAHKANSSSSSNPIVDTTDLPGSVADAWKAAADAAKPPGEQQEEAPITSTKNIDDRTVAVPPGQQAVAVRTICTANSLKRMADTADHVLKERKECAEFVLPQIPDNNYSTTNAASQWWWLQVLDERLQELRTYHAEHQATEETVKKRSWNARRWGDPVADGYDLAASVEQWTSTLDIDFSVDEVLGKYLDLQKQYETILHEIPNIVMQQDAAATTAAASTSSYQYIDFLEDLSKGIGEVWKEDDKLLKRRKYVRWLMELQDYLESFLQRTVPLLKLPDVTTPAEQDFVETWSKTGGYTGWHAKPAEAPLAKTLVSENDSKSEENGADSNKKALMSIDLNAYSTAEDLAANVDGDKLKAELSLLGLKCGGTVQDRAKRLFLLKDKTLEELPAKVFAKKKMKHNNADQGDAENKQNDAAIIVVNERRVDIARLEAIVCALLDQVRPTLEATIRRTERRQSQTLKEREQEIEEELYTAGVPKAKKTKTEDAEMSDSDDEDAPIYNPKNVPLDFDGRPIPYWLFKLHGLNHYYPCEICGGESYRGRRTFELHFAEQKHSAGMASLGIPNTKHFHGVTKIEDAQDLWKTLQGKLKEEQFDGTKEEEFEDSHGNVLSRTLYEDLARQGLL